MRVGDAVRDDVVPHLGVVLLYPYELLLQELEVSLEAVFPHIQEVVHPVQGALRFLEVRVGHVGDDIHRFIYAVLPPSVPVVVAEGGEAVDRACSPVEGVSAGE